MFWAIPLSTKQKVFDFYFNYTDINNQKVSAVLSQLKMVSIKRLDRKMYDIDETSFLDIKERLKSFLQ